MLQSEWSDGGWTFDRSESEPLGVGELYVAGLEASPEQYGQWAAQWFKRQLRRKVVRREWDRPSSGSDSEPRSRTAAGPAAVRWIIYDPEHDLGSRGGLRWWRLMRQPPTREVVERS